MGGGGGGSKSPHTLSNSKKEGKRKGKSEEETFEDETTHTRVSVGSTLWNFGSATWDLPLIIIFTYACPLCSTHVYDWHGQVKVW